MLADDLNTAITDWITNCMKDEMGDEELAAKYKELMSSERFAGTWYLYAPILPRLVVQIAADVMQAPTPETYYGILAAIFRDRTISFLGANPEGYAVSTHQYSDQIEWSKAVIATLTAVGELDRFRAAVGITIPTDPNIMH